jgi:hypothetical protein
MGLKHLGLSQMQIRDQKGASLGIPSGFIPEQFQLFSMPGETCSEHHVLGNQPWPMANW